MLSEDWRTFLAQIRIFIPEHYTHVLTICIVIFQQNNKRDIANALGQRANERAKETKATLFFVRAGDTTETLNLREYRIYAIWCFVGGDGGSVTHALKNQIHITLPLYLTLIHQLTRFCLRRTKCFEWIECTFSSGNSKIHFVHNVHTHRVRHSVIKQLARETRRKWAKVCEHNISTNANAFKGNLINPIICCCLKFNFLNVPFAHSNFILIAFLNLDLNF